jgi:hypothetical protein
MKIIALMLVMIVSAHAGIIRSPDKKFAIHAAETIELVDAAGTPIFTLQKSTTGDVKVEVAWAPDSQTVFVLENSARGSVIEAARLQNGVWHRLLEGEDYGRFIGRLSKQFASPIQSESRSLGTWPSENAIQVSAKMHFRNGRSAAHTYTLQFLDGPTIVDRGGFEEGSLIGKGL